MVKSCRTFDPGLVYSMDAIGVISTSLPKKLEWHVGDVKFVSESPCVNNELWLEINRHAFVAAQIRVPSFLLGSSL
jgi:hypothetical protein